MSLGNSTSAIDTFRPVVLAPSYNNAGTLGGVIDRLMQEAPPLIVVNDGATDGTAAILAQRAARFGAAKLIVVTHERNAGKAAALRTGFDTARRLGFTHVLTIDTDGQHDPAEVPALLRAAAAAPSALVLGVRSGRASGSPALNQLGWWMSALGIWLETGLRVLDSQCGLRVYPVGLIATVRCNTPRFGFETEIITRAAWAGFPIVEVPVTCRYFQEDQRVSHFRPGRDGVQAFLMHARLTLRRLVPWPPAGAARHDRVADQPSPDGRALRPRHWLDNVRPSALWRQLRQDRFAQLIVAAALGMGAFMAALPLGGWQIVLALYAAWRLHVHWVPAILAATLCLTPFGDGLDRVALGMGPVGRVAGGIAAGFFANWITIPLFVYVFRLIPVKVENVEATSGAAPAARQ